MTPAPEENDMARLRAENIRMKEALEIIASGMGSVHLKGPQKENSHFKAQAEAADLVNGFWQGFALSTLQSLKGEGSCP